MSKLLQFLAFVCVVLISFSIHAQDMLAGQIYDETLQPIPFADIYVKNQAELRTRADIDGNYLMRLEPGDYQLVFSAMGFEDRESFVIIQQGENRKDMQLFPIKVTDLEEFTVSAKDRNPGRDIILKVVERKDTLDFNQYAYSCDVYIKATEKIDRNQKEDHTNKEDEDDLTTDPFEAEKRAKQQALAKINNMKMVEVQLQRDYAPLNKVRETRTAFEKRGENNLLYFTTTAKSNFNFFKNILYLDDLNETPIPSPISAVGILSYKYKLVEQIEREGKPKIHKIEIKARSSATSTLQGFIWVEDSTFLVQNLALELVKGNLYQYDYFKIEQAFDTSSDTLCLLKDQVMSYGLKYKKAEHTCQTRAEYRNYNFNVNFPKKHFGNELAVTTKEAYERDSSYWENTRTTALTEEEQLYIRKRDSINDYLNRTEYLDSIDSVFNKINVLKVLWFGVDHRNRAKKVQWGFTSLASSINPVYIAGPRIGPGFDFFKKWENERTFDSYIETSVGLLNQDIKGEAWFRYMFNPFKFSTVGMGIDHDFDVIRGYDAFSQILLRDNFIETTELNLFYNTELVNGLYFNADIKFTERRSLYENTKFITWLDDELGNNTPPEQFKTYQAFIPTFTLSYTPFQKYMREPYRKVLLGSKWPTFYAYYEIGLPSVLGSDVNHDYLRFGIRQTFKISTFGTTTYHVTGGQFLRSKVLREIDYKYHRRSDPIWFSNPLFSYQDLDTALPTLDAYLETHFIHHFNGALINKIPFMKKTRITTVLGGGYLYIPEHNWQHAEMYAGLERVFKIAKRRLRIGVYGVVSDGNQIDPRTAFKVSFAMLDRRNMKFQF